MDNIKKNDFIPALRFNILTFLYDFGCNLVGLGKEYRRKIIDTLDLPNKKIKVLDAGCGTGNFAIELKIRKPRLELYAIDADAKILSMAKEKAQENNVKIEFHQAFLQKLPFSKEYFDVVFSSLVFHHLTRKIKEEALKEIHSILRKRGKFFLIDFGKPKNKFLSFSWFAMKFEEGYDNYKGNIPRMLVNSNFKRVRTIGRYRHDIDFLLAGK